MTVRNGAELQFSPNANRRTRPWKTALDVVASVVMITAGVVIVLAALRGRHIQETVPPHATVRVTNAITVGQPAAPVALVEFSDFQCAFCARFARETLPALVRQYVDSGRLLIALRHFPANSGHPFAFMAAEAAECARRQGKGWAMHELLFKDPTKLSEAVVRGYSEELGLESAAFGRCRQGEAVEEIRMDIEDATRLSIAATPAFLVGALQPDRTVRVMGTVSGAKPLAVFVGAIDRALSDLGLSTFGNR